MCAKHVVGNAEILIPALQSALTVFQGGGGARQSCRAEVVGFTILGPYLGGIKDENTNGVNIKGEMSAVAALHSDRGSLTHNDGTKYGTQVKASCGNSCPPPQKKTMRIQNARQRIEISTIHIQGAFAQPTPSTQIQAPLYVGVYWGRFFLRQGLGGAFDSAARCYARNKHQQEIDAR